MLHSVPGYMLGSGIKQMSQVDLDVQISGTSFDTYDGSRQAKQVCCRDTIALLTDQHEPAQAYFDYHTQRPLFASIISGQATLSALAVLKCQDCSDWHTSHNRHIFLITQSVLCKCIAVFGVQAGSTDTCLQLDIRRSSQRRFGSCSSAL